MASQDLHNNIDERVALATQLINTDTTTAGVIIDTAGFESLEFLMQAGVVTAGDVTLIMQDGDDSALSDVATVADAFRLGDLVTLDATGITRVGYVGKKRYVRVSAVTDNSGNLTVGAAAVLSNPHSAPVAQ